MYDNILNDALAAMNGTKNSPAGGCGGNCSGHEHSIPTPNRGYRSAMSFPSFVASHASDPLEAMMLDAIFNKLLTASTSAVAAPVMKVGSIQKKELGIRKFAHDENKETLTIEWTDGTTTVVDAEYDDWEEYTDLEKAFARAIMYKAIGIQRVLQQGTATVIFWNNGEKTVVKCQKNDDHDDEKGFLMAFAKYMLGNDGHYYEIFKDIVPGLGE